MILFVGINFRVISFKNCFNISNLGLKILLIQYASRKCTSINIKNRGSTQQQKLVFDKFNEITVVLLPKYQNYFVEFLEIFFKEFKDLFS